MTPIEKATAAARSLMEAVQEMSVTQPTVPSKGYKIARVDYPSTAPGGRRKVLITGPAPYGVKIAPELGKLTPDTPGSWWYEPTRAGQDQIQLENGAGEVWLLMMSVR